MDYIYIGKILGTIGLKGELKVRTDTDFIKERYKAGSVVYLLKDGDYLPYTIAHYRLYKNMLAVTFKDHEDINKVENLNGLAIYKSTKDIEPLKDGYYFHELVGLDVFVAGEKKGVVKKVEAGVVNNYLRVENGDREVLVPFIDKFIIGVDLHERRIDVIKLEGLL